MAESSLWYLENIDLRNVFCPAKQESLNEREQADFPANSYVYLPEEPAQDIYLINEGRVKIGTYSEDGKEITKAILGPGEVFGEMALIGQQQRRDFAYVMQDTKVCTLEKSDLSAMLKERNDLQLFFMRIIGKRTLELEQRLESLVFKSSKTRILEFLIQMVKEKGRAVGMEHEVKYMLTHKEIADLTATSRQTVNSVLNDLRNRNIITFNRRRMLVRDMEAMEGEV
ncbi:transcriptional regulator [Lewinellaceae bacterium SD302]|nr:transcriptional regulator [Lewinellaceae bacterium SD302]